MKKLLIIPLFLFSFYSYSQDVIWSKIASKNNVDIYLRYNIQQCSIFNLLYKHHDLFENIDCETKMKIINKSIVLSDLTITYIK
jgi:hypothetical protein